MKRLAVVIAMLALGCNKPSEDSCRQALANMQRLLGTENLHDDAKLEGEVRRCKGGSHKKAVECAIKAQTPEELYHCDFYKGTMRMPTLPSAPTGPVGSAAPAGSAVPAGSAATTGSAGPTGSATP